MADAVLTRDEALSAVWLVVDILAVVESIRRARELVLKGFAELREKRAAG